MLQMLNFMAH